MMAFFSFRLLIKVALLSGNLRSESRLHIGIDQSDSSHHVSFVTGLTRILAPFSPEQRWNPTILRLRLYTRTPQISNVPFKLYDLHAVIIFQLATRSIVLSAIELK